MTELLELLEKVGCRPAKHGTKWVCASCPPGKPPALKIGPDPEVYFCHRCQRGGNVITLRRELGLELVRQQRTPEQRRLRQCARVLGSLVKAWEKSQHRWLSKQLQNAYDRELAARDRGQSLLREGLEVDAATIDEAFSAAQERDWYCQWLDSFDRLSPAELVAEYIAFRTAIEGDTMIPNHQKTEMRNAL